MILKYLQQLTVLHLCFAISFITSGILLNVVQAILYWSLRYYSKRLYRQINYYLSYSFYCQLVFMSQWWSASQILVYIDKDEFNKYYGKEHGLLLMNHSYEIDWLMGWQFCDGIGVLGNCKAFSKKSIQYMPPIGWTWKFGEYIFLDRSYQKDKENIFRQISELGDYPDPIWLLLFAEGTRLSAEKLKNSQEFAKAKGLPILKHHLVPRTKGFVASLQGMRDKIKVIYDIQIAFDKDASVSPTITSLLLGKSVQAHLYINRILVDDIPKEDSDIEQWLHQHYEKKDRMQESFYKTGSFFKESGVREIAPYTIPRKIWPVINTVTWNIIVLVPMLRYLLSWLFSGELLYFSIAFSILASFYFMMKHVIGLSEIRKASSYGTASKKKD